MMQYKGYVGNVEFDDECQWLWGGGGPPLAMVGVPVSSDFLYL